MELPEMLQPLVGKSPQHMQITQNFVESIKDILLQPGEFITSYDVTALCTSVPIEPALDIIKKFQQDHTLFHRT